MANAAGYLFNLYQRTAWSDEVAHGYTLFTLTLAVVDLIYGKIWTGRNHHPLLVVLVITMIGAGMGAVWELVEAAYDAMSSGNVIRGKYDTMIDLVADAVGAALAGIFSIVPRRDTD